SERVKGVVRLSALSSPAERAGWRTRGPMVVANCGPPWDEKPKRPAYTGRRREAFGSSPPLRTHMRRPCRAVEHTTLGPSDICGADGEAPSGRHGPTCLLRVGKRCSVPKGQRRRSAARSGLPEDNNGRAFLISSSRGAA